MDDAARVIQRFWQMARERKKILKKIKT